MGAVRETDMPNDESLSPVIDAATSALALESARAERLDTKARGQMTLAGSWFAIVQAVAAVALSSGTPQGWVIGIGGCAVVAAVVLFVAMHEAAKVWKLRPQPAITQETLEDMATAARSDPASFADNLIVQYRHLLGHTQEQNAYRATALDSATAWWWAAMGFAFVELAVALGSRIFGV